MGGGYRTFLCHGRCIMDHPCSLLEGERQSWLRIREYAGCVKCVIVSDNRPRGRPRACEISVFYTIVKVLYDLASSWTIISCTTQPRKQLRRRVWQLINESKACSRLHDHEAQDFDNPQLLIPTDASRRRP